MRGCVREGDIIDSIVYIYENKRMINMKRGEERRGWDGRGYDR